MNGRKIRLALLIFAGMAISGLLGIAVGYTAALITDRYNEETHIESRPSKASSDREKGYLVLFI